MTTVKQIEFLQSIAPRYTRDINEANDLVQDTLYKSIKKRHLFKEGTNLKAWLATIMKNNFINGLRKKKREVHMGHQNDWSHLAPTTEIADTDFVLKDVTAFVHNLPEEYSEPLLMFVNGYSYDEIARKYNAPLGTIKSRIFHARKRIKRQFRHLHQN